MTMSPEKKATELIRVNKHPPTTQKTVNKNTKKKIIFNLLYKCSGPYFSWAVWKQNRSVTDFRTEQNSKPINT